MSESIKNHEGSFPVGTRVSLAHDRMSRRVGTVIDVDAHDGAMQVRWDGSIAGCYHLPAELKRPE